MKTPDLTKKKVVTDDSFKASGRKDVYGGLNTTDQNKVKEIVQERDAYAKGIDDCERRIDTKLKQLNSDKNKRG